MPRIEIDNLDDPRFDPYRNLKTTNYARHHGLFVAESRKVVRRLIESDFDIDSVLVSRQRAAEFAELLDEAVPLYVLPLERAEELVGYNFHVGVMACGRRKPNPELSDLFCHATGPQFVVACLGVIDPQNIGAIIRISSAFGAAAVVLDEHCSDPFSRRVLRVSMATCLKIPIIQTKQPQELFESLRQDWDFEIAATVLDEDAEPLSTYSPSARTVLVFGNESDGLSRDVADCCDRRLTIPMAEGIDSLNVSIAAGIFTYQLARSRG